MTDIYRNIPEKCFFCVNWHPEVTALDKRLAMIAEIRAARGDQNENIPPMYGKCRAQIINKDHEEETIDKGTLSTHDCNVVDYDGYNAFQPVPED